MVYGIFNHDVLDRLPTKSKTIFFVEPLEILCRTLWALESEPTKKSVLGLLGGYTSCDPPGTGSCSFPDLCRILNGFAILAV